MRPIPTYGDVFEIKDFVKMCLDRVLTDWDGDGHPIVDGMMDETVDIRPSKVVKGLDRQYKQIIWFNK